MGRAAFAVPLSLAVIAGCSLATSVIAPPDGIGGPNIDASLGGHDASRTGDAVVTDDVFTPMNDAFTPMNDAFTPMNDAYVAPIDMGTDAYVAPTDMGTDAWAGDASTACDRAYGNQPGYHVCNGTTGTTCVFYVNFGSTSHSCSHACGSNCVSAIGNQDGSMCTTDNTPIPCTQTFQDAICTCTP
jgi:hypothetical protein